jgi:hypothetical protein
MWGSCSLRVFLVGIMDKGRGLVVERGNAPKKHMVRGRYLSFLPFFRFTFFFVSFQTIMSFFIGFFFTFASYNLVLNFSFVFACRNL